MDIKEIVSEGLMAFVPEYILTGDCTKLYTEQKGVYEVEKNVKSILNQLCKYYCMDLKASREYYGDILSIKNLVPIPFTEKDVFVYVKTREPRCKNDSAFGFVNIRYIANVVEHKDEAIIEFNNREKIKCLVSSEVVDKHIKRGNIAR